jgi:hypothetical protein
MKRAILLSCLFAFIYTVGQAQGVRETVEPKINQMMQRFIELNKSQKNLKGWRIQIMATTDRQRMESALQQFQALYPNVTADWIHAKPYFKVRAGAFETKRDAQAILYLLKRDYPAAYLVQDNEIKPVELLR